MSRSARVVRSRTYCLYAACVHMQWMYVWYIKTTCTAGPVSSRSSGQGLWTPHRWGAAFSCQLIATLNKAATHSFSKLWCYDYIVHVIENSGDRFKKVSYWAPESGCPSSDSNWQCYYMLGTTTRLSMPFRVLKEIFFLVLGLTVTEISIKKVQKQNLR